LGLTFESGDLGRLGCPPMQGRLLGGVRRSVLQRFALLDRGLLLTRRPRDLLFAFRLALLDALATVFGFDLDPEPIALGRGVGALLHERRFLASQLGCLGFLRGVDLRFGLRLLKVPFALQVVVAEQRADGRLGLADDCTE
jgi:hypothetical protein